MAKKLLNFLVQRRKAVIGFVLVLFCFLLILPLAFYFLDLTPARLHIDGNSAGQIKKRELKSFLEKRFQIKNKKDIVLVIENKSLKVNPAEAGILLDAEKTFEKIIRLYFSKPDFPLYLRWLEAFYVGKEVSPEFEISNEKINKLKSWLDQKFGEKPVNAFVSFNEDGTPVYKKEKTGKLFLTKDIVRAFEKALVFEKPVKLSLRQVEPEILLADVKELVKNQLGIFSQKTLVIYFGEVEKKIEAKELIKTLGSGLVENRLTFVVLPSKLNEFCRQFFKEISQKPEDASFEVVNGQVVIIPDKPGLDVDVTKTADLASRQLLISQIARVEVATKKVEANITVEEAKKFGIKELVSSFTTEYNPKQTARVENIKLLARLLDGQLIAPGETFSFNERIGPRTLERGFKLAPTIINGRLVDTAGGGACQVGTTLFNTAFFAGMKIVERHNHSFYISHYPAGRDATVSYGGYDLRFKNDYRSWILIKAYATNSKITISFYGTKENRKVVYKTEGPFNLTPFKTEEVKDPALPAGFRKVEDKGIMGRRYVVTRYVYDSSGKLLYRDVFKSFYKPKSEIVRVGTGVPVPKETTSTTESGS